MGLTPYSFCLWDFSLHKTIFAYKCSLYITMSPIIYGKDLYVVSRDLELGKWSLNAVSLSQLTSTKRILSPAGARSPDDGFALGNERESLGL